MERGSFGQYPMTLHHGVDWILTNITDGDEHGWDAEFEYLLSQHSERIDEIISTAKIRGIIAPILIGPDLRIWDGHHRLCAAVQLGLATIPVEYA